MKRFTLLSRYKSFCFAIKGLQEFLRTQHNAWIESATAIAVILLGIYFKLTLTEWMGIIFAIALVFIAEIFNTAIEYLTDLVSPDFNPKAGKIKDLAAAGVLIAAVAAGTIGGFIFFPYLRSICA